MGVVRRSLIVLSVLVVGSATAADAGPDARPASSGNGLDEAWVGQLEPLRVLVLVDSMPDEQLLALENGVKVGGKAVGGGLITGSAIAVGELSTLGFAAAIPGVVFGVGAYFAIVESASAADVERALVNSSAARTTMQQVDSAEDWDARFASALERELDALFWARSAGAPIIVRRDRIAAELRAKRKHVLETTIDREFDERSEAAVRDAIATPESAVFLVSVLRGVPASLTGSFRTVDVRLYSRSIAPLAYELVWKGKYTPIRRSWSDAPVYRAVYASVTTPVDLSKLKAAPPEFTAELHARIDATAAREAAEIAATRRPTIAALRLSELENWRIREHYLADDPDEWDIDRTADFMDEKWRPQEPEFYRDMMASDIDALARTVAADLARLEPANSVAKRRPAVR